MTHTNRIDVSLNLFGKEHSVPSDRAVILVNGSAAEPPMTVEDFGDLMHEFVHDLLTLNVKWEQNEISLDEFRTRQASVLSTAALILIVAGWGSEGVVPSDMINALKRAHQEEGLDMPSPREEQ